MPWAKTGKPSQRVGSMVENQWQARLDEERGKLGQKTGILTPHLEKQT